jgi:hypothetical protein
MQKNVRRWAVAGGAVAVAASVAVGTGAVALPSSSSDPEVQAEASLDRLADAGRVDPALVEWMTQGPGPSGPSQAEIAAIDDQPSEAQIDEGNLADQMSAAEARRLARLQSEALAAAEDLAAAWAPRITEYDAASPARRSELMVEFVVQHQRRIRRAKDSAEAAAAEFRRLGGED